MIEISSTSEVLARALDVCALRQAVYSSNIANANVDGYRRLEVEFDAQEMRESVEKAAASLDGGSVSAEDVSTRVVATQSAVKLDEEMAAMAKNAVRYEMLLGLYEKSFGAMRTAIHEGRGS